MPLFQAIVIETVTQRRWYYVKARNLDHAIAKLNVGNTFDEQNILGSTEVLHRFVQPDTLARTPFLEMQKP